MDFLNNDTNEGGSNSPHLSKEMKEFLNELSQRNEQPLYEMAPEQARDFLSSIQQESKHEISAEVEDTIVMTPEMDNVDVRIVRPKNKDNEVLPAILYIHGGGWVMGGKDTHDYLIKKLSLCSNAAVIFPDYELSPEARYPKAIDQCYSVLKYISNHPDEFNIDSDKIIVAGDSAGANMAAAIALRAKLENGPKIYYQMLLYPVTSAKMNTKSYSDFKDGPWLSKKSMEWFWDMYAPEKERREEIYASVLNASLDELSGLPAALILTNQNDVLRDEGELYAQKLMDAGVKVASVRINGVIHDSMMLNAINLDTSVQAAYALCCKILKEIFSKG